LWAAPATRMVEYRDGTVGGLARCLQPCVLLTGLRAGVDQCIGRLDLRPTGPKGAIPKLHADQGGSREPLGPWLHPTGRDDGRAGLRPALPALRPSFLDGGWRQQRCAFWVGRPLTGDTSELQDAPRGGPRPTCAASPGGFPSAPAASIIQDVRLRPWRRYGGRACALPPAPPSSLWALGPEPQRGGGAGRLQDGQAGPADMRLIFRVGPEGPPPLVLPGWPVAKPNFRVLEF
jgi:hypothetical protein